MAIIRDQMQSQDGKVIYATAELHKFYVPIHKEHAAARIEWNIEMGARKVEIGCIVL